MGRATNRRLGGARKAASTNRGAPTATSAKPSHSKAITTTSGTEYTSGSANPPPWEGLHPEKTEGKRRRQLTEGRKYHR